MPDYDDENNPLSSSKKFGSIRFRKSGTSSKRRSELKATISGPHALGGGGISTSLGDAPLRTLNGTRPLHHPNSASTLLNASPPPQTSVGGTRRNSDMPLRQHPSSLAWPSNHPEMTPVHISPHHPPRTTPKKARKVDISKPLVLDSSRFSSAPGMSRGRSRRSTQINRGSRWSETVASDIFKGNPDKVASQGLSLSDQQALDPNLLGVPSDEFDPRTMMEPSPALDLDIPTGVASFGSVKLRTKKIDKTLRASRTALLPAPRKAKPDLVYTDDSDAFSSPPSTPSTPVWETTAALSISKTAPEPAASLELADVHAQIQAMIDSANRPFSTEPEDHPAQDQELTNTQRNDIPLSLRPGNPMRMSLPRLARAHRRSASSPPLGSDTYHTSPPDSRAWSSYRPISPVMSAPPASPPHTPTSPTSTTPADPMTPTTPTKKPFSECSGSDSPSVYSQLSPSSQIGNVTPTSSNTSSPDHPYARSKHDRLLAAISEGISSPTKPGHTAPSILGSRSGRVGKASLASPPLNTQIPAVPMIVVTDPNDDDIVYSESFFSIVDMYAGSVESFEAGVRRRRSRTANSVSHVSPSSIERVLITP